MKSLLSLFIIFGLQACASKKEVIEGYEKSDLEKRRRWIHGKTPREIVKLLGNPAIEGECRSCGRNGVYKIIYLTKDMSKFYYNLSLNTDMEVDCIQIELGRDSKNNFVFRNNSSIRVEKNCNQTEGAILKLKQILDEQEAQDVIKSKTKR